MKNIVKYVKIIIINLFRNNSALNCIKFDMINNKSKINELPLIKSFTNTYEKFFLENPLVLSWNLSFSLLPPITNLVWWFAIVQKIPSKIYLWIKISEKTNISINNIKIYNKNEDAFIKDSFIEINNEIILEYVKNFLKKNNFHKWLEINILCEKWKNFSLYANTVSLLTIWLYTIIWKISHEKDEINRKNSLIEMQKTAKELYWPWLSSKKINNTYNIQVSLTKSKEPLIIFPTNKKTNKPNIEKLFDFFKETKKSELDLDIVIVDFWIDYWFDITKKKTSNYISYTGKKIEEYKKKLINYNPEITIPKYNEIERSLHTIIDVEKIKTLGFFGDVIKNPFDYHNIEKLIENYNNRYSFSTLIEKQSNVINTLQKLLNQNKTYYEEYITVFPFKTSEIWGSIIIIAPWKKSRNTILKALEELKNTYKYNLSLDYISREEWVGWEEIKVEQNLYKQFSSPFIQDNLILAKTLQWESFIDKHENLIKRYNKAIIMDLVEKKIYIKGVKTTSNEILSQNFTIELFNKLLETTENEVSNKELPISSYSKYKNQLVGKIIIPLQKIIEKKFNKKLDILCKWSNHDFTIKLKESILPIVIIKKYVN